MKRDFALPLLPALTFAHFCVDGGHENTLRLNFSNSTVDQIITGMDILNELVAAMK